MTPDLRALAEKATPGPWTPEDRMVLTPSRTVVADVLDVHGVLREGTARYIAAASPDVMLALLDERDRLRAALEEAGRRLSRWSHDEDCCVWTCETCDRIDPGDHLSGHEDPTHAGCDCGIAEIVSYLEAALLDAQPGQEEP